MDNLTNEQVIAKKTELSKQIQQIEKVLNSSNYRAKDGCGFSQAEINEMKAKSAKLLAEYRALPNIQFNEGVIPVNKMVIFSNGRFILKYVAEAKRWDFYDGTQYMTSNVTFLDENTVKIIQTTINSDNYGEPVDHVFILKVGTPNDPVIQKAVVPHLIFPKGFVMETEQQPQLTVTPNTKKGSKIGRFRK
jgi:hypothetical protein